MSAQFLTGNVFDLVSEIPEFQCLCTSPPYYFKRWYPVPDVIIGGERECEHEWTERPPPRSRGKDDATSGTDAAASFDAVPSQKCAKCGAYQGQLGQESTCQEFVEHLGDLFLALADRMHDTGTMWINIGDSRCAEKQDGVPKKGLFGVPYRLAFYLQERGLLWRNNIVWSKVAGMPDSAQDRLPAKHEAILMFSKSDRYKFDRWAITEPHKESSKKRYEYGISGKGKYSTDGTLKQGLSAKSDKLGNSVSRDGVSLRDVWEFGGANHRSDVGEHCAPMPDEIARRAILLSTDEGDTVLDPFGGTGTTAAVAVLNGRNAVNVDLDGRSQAFYEERLSRARQIETPKPPPPPDGQGKLL